MEHQSNTAEERMIAAAAAGDMQGLQSALDEGADVAYQDKGGMTALMHAADGGHKEAVECLLQSGCPWNMQDNDGYCAGEYAAGHPDIVALLMEWGVQAEMVLGEAERARKQSQGATAAVNSDYLQQKLHYTEDGTKLLDADGEAVMMGWEGPLMVRHAAVICSHGGDVLNIGFGLGLVDDAIQTHNPSSHTIIEAHPDVFAHATSLGWGTRKGVHLLQGRWQDVIMNELIPNGKKFDGIFIDTYGEFYEEMYDFHQLLAKILKPGGTYSFFNGFGSDNLFFHTVYGRLIQLQLETLGFVTTYERVPIKEAVDEAVWEGVKNKYWKLPFYFLPTCIYKKDAGDQAV